MTIYYSDICRRIYALSALATLNPHADIALFHPDHADALNVVVRDCIATIISEIPQNLIQRNELFDDYAEITLYDKYLDTETIAHAFHSAVTSLTLCQLKIAASADSQAVITLAQSIPVIISPVINALSAPIRPARILPY